MKVITVVTATYNEEENVLPLYQRVREVMQRSLPQYRYEHLFIDNASTDQTVPILKEIARDDHAVKIIVNNRNFGHIRSPFYGLCQAEGDAVISLVADFQDPPELLPEFVKKWEQGSKMVLGVKEASKESPVMFRIRTLYYALISRISGIPLVNNFTGFGLYDKDVIACLRTIQDPYPYFRGLICELGFPASLLPYTQPARMRGITKNNFYSLYDMAMLGITSHSKVPLRLATILGFVFSIISGTIAIFYLIIKLLFWYSFPAGMAPILIGLFVFFSVQLFFIGLLGEYIGSIHTQVLRRPLVTVKERINFDEQPHASR